MTDTSTPADLGELVTLAEASHRVIATHQAPSGAYPASPTFSAYRGYSWFRDGAFIAEGASRYGDADGPAAFHRWCADVLTKRTDQVDALVGRAGRGEHIPVADMLPTRYTIDGAVGNDPWWDFQLDGYGTWLWALAAHADRHGPVDGVDGGVATAVRYLTTFWARPCYDWWEEHVDHRHVSTLGAIRAGLAAATAHPALAGALPGALRSAAAEAAAAIDSLVLAEGVVDGHLMKWLGAADVDASLLACVAPFGLVGVESAIGRATVDAVEAALCVDGGVHRYAADTFYGGGQWPLLTALLGWNHAAAGRREKALASLRWIAAQATPDGELPEQVGHHLLAPDREQEWIDRWGTVATPLLWSHGMYLTLAAELGLVGSAR
ncbi:glycoside hydrolase family 15 [Jiangella aurantiaca]|uniref:Glycoside hydrolase family 15 n=1 Tax=Jiangella aurantiaca TaxID=2530373 RepID=A0A4R5ADE7_9ACTN|nr:glycoside hydrolase family 15 protein [Jiangella aurantiaca]TDD70498.1 glycoside hydrolase family 15 [Jiangella aurantiaca]